ncbi:hypothetical protein [Paenibacillus sp. tmac-D7]|uniref:hypothetical protein n=1 Tax=Paenibacillus sp. tmac-D7 TaxID=2591462 RepID=UPI00114202CA|nr:hypothetical protein [Paenibacillus sp. tmac-D7]
MNTPIETNLPQAPIRTGRPKQAKPRTYTILIVSWIILVGLGIWGAKAYTDYLQLQIKTDIAAQIENQLAAVQEDYQKQIGDLKQSMSADMTQLQSKIDSVNELLSFTKDSASSKTDNSNQLYTQLADVTKKLDDLKKQLDALQ